MTNGTAVVGSYAPNSWGLYDMHGNVWEWCLDWYAADIAGLGGAVNMAAGTSRVQRGGSWNNDAGNCRAARRNDNAPANRNNDIGFRLALPARPPASRRNAVMEVTDAASSSSPRSPLRCHPSSARTRAR